MTSETNNMDFALVVKVIDDSKIVINRGSEDGINLGQRFLIFTIENEEIVDPKTKKSLGFLEIIRGTGIATHVQQKLTTIQSDKEKKSGRSIIKRNFPSFTQFIGQEEVVINPSETQPFDNPTIGDFVKPI
mgnify:CR=1 FL=1